MKTNTIVIICFIVILCAILSISTCHKTADAESEAIINMHDIITRYRDQNGQLVTLAKVLKVNNAKSVIAIITKDSQIIHLQNILKAQKGKVESVILHDIVTQYRDTGRIIYNHNDSLKTWSYSVDNEFIKSELSVTNDTAIYKLKVYNKLSYVHKQVPRGLFGLAGTDHIITATDQNPYSTTTTLNSLVIRERRRPLGIGLQAGITYSPAKTINPYIGVGISYHIINF